MAFPFFSQPLCRFSKQSTNENQLQGSIELLAQGPDSYNAEYPENENPFGLFLLGLFLNHNNLNASASEIDFQDIYNLLIEIFQKNTLLLILKC